jgi:hypothetical protein
MTVSFLKGKKMIPVIHGVIEPAFIEVQKAFQCNLGRGGGYSKIIFRKSLHLLFFLGKNFERSLLCLSFFVYRLDKVYEQAPQGRS